MELKTVEISSYPKSGNTWFLAITFHAMKGMGVEKPQYPKTIHSDKEAILNKTFVAIPGTGSKWFTYKSHIVDNPELQPTAILYLFRHPLDVLLSALNFLSLRANEGALSQARQVQVFKGGVVKNCDQISADGQMGFYCSRFTKDLGKSLFPAYQRYSTHVTNALENPKVTAIRYEDLVNDTLTTAKRALSKVFDIGVDDFEIDLDIVQRSTAGSGSPFHWKSKSGTRFEYLSPKQIAKFERKHHKLLARLEYLE